MSALLKLRPQKRTLELLCGKVTVFPLKISQIVDFIDEHKWIVSDYRAGKPIAESVTKAGPSAVFYVIDCATREEFGTAEQAEDEGILTPIDTAEILEAAIFLSLPGDRLGKLLARVEEHLPEGLLEDVGKSE